MPLYGAGGGLLTAQQERDAFVSRILAITGDTRLFWLPKATDTTTSADESLNGNTATHNASIATRLTASGLGQMVTFSPGSSHHAIINDTAPLTFGNGSTDSAFSIVALANVTDTAAGRIIFSKLETNDGTGDGGEYYFGVNSSDKLQLVLWDNSTLAAPDRTSDAAITMGSTRLFAATYAGTGGATAANGITLYQDAVAIASTATNSGSYVAMEDKASEVCIGSFINHSISFMNGSLGLVLVCAKVLSASELWAMKKAINSFFGLSL